MAIQLEGRRSTDNAWYHCEVSPWSNGGDYILKVQFPGEDEEYISTPDEALSRLRPLSRSLQNGECKELQVGDSVLASLHGLSQKEACPRDAKIKAVHMYEHLPSETCTCRLEVLPMDGGTEGLVNILASQVRRINIEGSVRDHQVVFDWIQAKSRQGSHWFNNSDAEGDVQAQLDMEIDKLTKMTESTNETSMTENSPAAAAVRRSSRNTRGNIRQESLPLPVCRRRLANDQSGNSAHRVLPVGKQPRLSPLAARAALAATLPTGPLLQMQQPGLLDFKETPLGKTKRRRESRPTAIAHSASPKAQMDCKAKEQKRWSISARSVREHTCVSLNPLYLGSNPFMVLVNRADILEDVEVSLSLDMLPEMSVDLVVDLPIFDS